MNKQNTVVLSYLESNPDSNLAIEQQTEINPVEYKKTKKCYIHNRRFIAPYDKRDTNEVYTGVNKSTLSTFFKGVKQKDYNPVNTDEDREIILVDRWAAANYFHWIYQVIPAIYHAIKAYPNPLLITHSMKSWQKELLELSFEELPDIYELDDEKAYSFKRLTISSLASRYASCNMMDAWFKTDPELYKPALSIKKNKSLFSDQHGTRLYLTRKDQERRPLTNENEIELMLKDLGFMVVDTSMLTIKDQVKLFDSTEIVVGATGAAFANLGFCRPGTKVCILHYSSYKNMCGSYATLAAMLKMKAYVYNENDVNSAGWLNHWDTDEWSINIPRLKKFLENVVISEDTTGFKPYHFTQKWNPEPYKPKLRQTS